MKVIPIGVGPFQVNCYLAVGPNQQALVVDPGDDAGIIAVTLRQNKLTVAAYLITHGHMDHVSGLAELTRTFPAPVSIHPLDESWAFSKLNQSLPYYDTPERPKKIERLLAHGQVYSDAGLRYEIIATPGHSPGGACFYFPDEKAIFTGDTLFLGTIGRTDLEGSDEMLMTQSLARLAKLPEDTAVYPGHGPHTTIGQEKRTNSFMQF
jgi:glyoxylase-like metal-dependent hydrolase (beta-lactamase superfamily II)